MQSLQFLEEKDDQNILGNSEDEESVVRENRIKNTAV
jgi:hypothetical protein